MPCAVIIVTHNSQSCISICLNALKQQTKAPHKIIIIDSGSEDTAYLKAYSEEAEVTLLADNIGFCQGNNKGMTCVQNDVRYVLFLNPDAFLTPTFIEDAICLMEQPSANHIGALSGMLLGYSLQEDKPTGLIDSAGIFRTWYGRWYDRGQGRPQASLCVPRTEKVPALCGALMFCRLQALRSIELGPNIVMDPDFYMYKEDIDLSLRLQQQGWSLLFVPHLIAYHCRGWQDRSKMARHLRLMSAKNEMRLYARLKSPCILYSALKYFLVKVCNY